MIGQSITGKRDIVEELMHPDSILANLTVDVLLVVAIRMLYFIHKVKPKQTIDSQ
jgi:hypothetical protein